MISGLDSVLGTFWESMKREVVVIMPMITAVPILYHIEDELAENIISQLLFLLA